MREPTPYELLLDETVRFVTGSLVGRPRVLNVGANAREVSRKLADAGVAVTAIDHDELHGFRAEPFDAVVFSGALSEAPALELAVHRTADLLRPNGRLIVDDLDIEAPDENTLRWYFELHDLLASAGLFQRPSNDVGRMQSHRLRWQLAQPGYAVQHSGAAMRIAISNRFVIRELRRCEYLYRLMAHGLAADDRGASIVEELRQVEREGIQRDELVPVGLRIVADLR
jgi:SAM-dependent methyltransferase